MTQIPENKINKLKIGSEIKKHGHSIKTRVDYPDGINPVFYHTINDKYLCKDIMEALDYAFLNPIPKTAK